MYPRYNTLLPLTRSGSSGRPPTGNDTVTQTASKMADKININAYCVFLNHLIDRQLIF